MKHIGKRMLAMLLALIFCVSLLPAAALAEAPADGDDGATPPSPTQAPETPPLAGEDNDDPDALPAEDGTQANYVFTVQPTGGNVMPEGTITISFATNFTVEDAQLWYRIEDTSMSSGYATKRVFADYADCAFTLDWETVRAAPADAEWYIEADYATGYGNFITSDFFTLTYTPRGFTLQPAGGNVMPEGTITVSFATNFTCTYAELWYKTADPDEWSGYHTVQVNIPHENHTFTVDWDTVVAVPEDARWFVRAKYGSGLGEWVNSDDFILTYTPRLHAPARWRERGAGRHDQGQL